MKLNDEQWKQLRNAVEHDGKETFERLISELVRIAVMHERKHQEICDRVRAREREHDDRYRSFF